MRTALLYIAGTILLTLLFVYIYAHKDRGGEYAEPYRYADGVMTLESGTRVSLEFVESFADRVRGLSKQQSIGESEGLLFFFPSMDTHGIWMKDMYFPIDIIWLDEDLRVVDIKKNADPSSYTSAIDAEVFSPRTPSRYVLEVSAGFSDKNNLKIGEIFTLEINQ